MDFIVIKCCQCLMFQVHQRKKSKKWLCKICGKKQSLFKVHYEGTSRDCRKIVQDANMKKQNLETVFSDITNNKSALSSNVSRSEWKSCKKNSKWEVFKTDFTDHLSDEDNESCADLKQVCGNSNNTRKYWQTLSPSSSKNLGKRKRIDNSSSIKRQNLSKEHADNQVSNCTGTLRKSSKWISYYKSDGDSAEIV